MDQDGNVLEQYYDTTPQAGDNVYLTIDIDLQQAAEEALEDLILDLRENGVDGEEEGKDAEGGAMVVMDVNTGYRDTGSADFRWGAEYCRDWLQWSA